MQQMESSQKVEGRNPPASLTLERGAPLCTLLQGFCQLALAHVLPQPHVLQEAQVGL